MSTPRYRAWKFVHPDLDTAEGNLAIPTSNDAGASSYGGRSERWQGNLAIPTSNDAGASSYGGRSERWQGATGLSLSPRGGIAMVDDHNSVRQAILLLLSTTPGERIMRPEYGCQLRRLVFSPNDETTAGLAIHYVRQALDRWEPRIDVLRLDAGRNPDQPEQLNIHLEYRVRATQQLDTATFALNLAGGEI